MRVSIKTPPQITYMRKGGAILAAILNELKTQVVPGITPKAISASCQKLLKQHRAQAAFLGYQGFPDVLCVSVNDEVVHGIPSGRPFKEGDVVSLDLGVKYKGFITDSALSLVVGADSNKDKNRLLEGTAQALELGINQAVAGNHVGDISGAIEQRLKASNLAIIRSLKGHGVGTTLHEPPEIANFSTNNRGPKLVAGMTIAIEPMATLGADAVQVDEDNWTIRTQDGSLAAHFEHTILITDSLPEVLTAAKL